MIAARNKVIFVSGRRDDYHHRRGTASERNAEGTERKVNWIPARCAKDTTVINLISELSLPRDGFLVRFAAGSSKERRTVEELVRDASLENNLASRYSTRACALKTSRPIALRLRRGSSFSSFTSSATPFSRYRGIAR